MKHYIVTVTAADQVGIVHAISGTLRARGGNILELSQTVMRGYFTLILEVAFPEPLSMKGLAGALTADAEKYDVTAVVIEADEKARRVPVLDGERFILTVLGNDAVGNVHGISGRLAERGVNIVDLHARVDGDRFSLVMEAFLPPHLSPAERARRPREVRPGARAWKPTSNTKTSFWRPASRVPCGSLPSRFKETPLYRTEDVLATLGMIRQHKLDVRTVTMGIDLSSCASPNLAELCDRTRDRLLHFAGRLKQVCREVERRYGIPIVNRRIAVSPIAGGRFGALGGGLSGTGADARRRRRGGGRRPCRRVFGTGAKGLDGRGEAADRHVAGSAFDNQARLRQRERRDDGGRDQHGCDPGARTCVERHRRADPRHDGFGCAKLVIFANAPSRQSVHGRCVPRRRASPIA